MNDPTDLYAHVCAELEIVKVERDLLAKQPAGVLLAAMRQIVREADAACRGATVQAVGIATLQYIRKLALDAIPAQEKSAPRFPNVTCSQCGGEFGPGDHGFSHCENHRHLRRIG